MARVERRFRDRGTDGAYLFAAVQFISGVGCGFGCGGRVLGVLGRP